MEVTNKEVVEFKNQPFHLNTTKMVCVFTKGNVRPLKDVLKDKETVNRFTDDEIYYINEKFSQCIS